MLARGFILLTIVAQWGILAQVSGQFWWLNPTLTNSLAPNRTSKRIESTVKLQEAPQTTNGDCSCVLKCQCDDPPLDFVFESDEDSRESCAFPHETCCHILRLPIPANCSSSSRFTDNTLEDRASSSNLKEFPWLLSLSIERQPNVCGAAILSATAAITAAHCVSPSSHPSSYSIRTTIGHERIVSEIIKHNSYYSGGRYNDVAIIKWDKPLIIPHYADTIQLADEDDFIDEDSSCYAIELGNSHPVPLNVMSPHLCEAVLKEGRLGRGFQLHSSFLCAVTNYPGTCKAQGGNLLVCQRHRGVPLLAGVASWGFKCNEPRIFTNVSVFENWIEDNLEKYYFLTDTLILQ